MNPTPKSAAVRVMPSGAPAAHTRGGDAQHRQGQKPEPDDEVEDRVQRGDDPPRTLPGRFLLK